MACFFNNSEMHAIMMVMPARRSLKWTWGSEEHDKREIQVAHYQGKKAQISVFSVSWSRQAHPLSCTQ